MRLRSPLCLLLAAALVVSITPAPRPDDQNAHSVQLLAIAAQSRTLHVSRADERPAHARHVQNSDVASTAVAVAHHDRDRFGLVAAIRHLRPDSPDVWTTRGRSPPTIIS